MARSAPSLSLPIALVLCLAAAPLPTGAHDHRHILRPGQCAVISYTVDGTDTCVTQLSVNVQSAHVTTYEDHEHNNTPGFASWYKNSSYPIQVAQCKGASGDLYGSTSAIAPTPAITPAPGTEAAAAAPAPAETPYTEAAYAASVCNDASARFGSVLSSYSYVIPVNTTAEQASNADTAPNTARGPPAEDTTCYKTMSFAFTNDCRSNVTLDLQSILTASGVAGGAAAPAPSPSAGGSGMGGGAVSGAGAPAPSPSTGTGGTGVGNGAVGGAGAPAPAPSPSAGGVGVGTGAVSGGAGAAPVPAPSAGGTAASNRTSGDGSAPAPAPGAGSIGASTGGTISGAGNSAATAAAMSTSAVLAFIAFAVALV